MSDLCNVILKGPFHFEADKTHKNLTKFALETVQNPL